MEAPDSFGNNPFSYHLSLSPELLYILQWILENEQDTLKAIMHRALTQGDIQHIQAFLELSEDDVAEAHNTIIDFFTALEATLSMTVEEDSVKSTLARTMLPALDKIDSTAYDSITVASSAEQAAVKHEKNPNTNPQELLYQELLKRWKPHKTPTLVN